MKSRATWFFFVLLLSGCGRDPSSDQDRYEKFTCPTAIYNDQHRIHIGTKSEGPERVAVELDGQIKYDECQENPYAKEPPFVKFREQEGSFLIDVIHAGAYNEYPKAVSFKIIDRTNCQMEEILFEVEEEPLNFQTTYPNGKNCASKTSAELYLEME